MTVSSLSPSGEAAWQSLRQHVEWTPGFWLGWIFTDHTPSGRELFDRVADQLRGLGRSSVIRQPGSPEELVEQLAWVLGGADGADGCIAIEIRSQSKDWVERWDELLLRLNERRELLRRVLRGGLLLIAPTAVKSHTRVAAPDLWSIRSLALDVEPPGRLAALHFSELRVRAEISAEHEGNATEGATELALARHAVDDAQRAGQPVALTVARIRLARVHMAAERGLEARETAILAAAEAPSDELAAEALVTLGRIEINLDDLVAAERHYREALDRSPSTLSARALREFSKVLYRRHALDDALRIAHMNLDKIRAEHERGGEDWKALRDESVVLDAMGNIAYERGELVQSLDWYRQSLGLELRARAITGETPVSLRYEFITINRIGVLVSKQGNLAAAQDLFRQGLAILRRIRGLVGVTAQTLRDESLSLEEIGLVLREQGDKDGSLDLFRQSLQLRRTIRGMNGDTRMSLRDESVSLNHVGDGLRARGELSASLEVYRQSLELAQQVRALAGDTAETLHDESVFLYKISRVLRSQGELADARKAAMQSLDLTRRVRAIVGELPRALRSESVTMTEVAAILREEGESLDALELERQSLALDRRVHALVGDTPEALRDVSIALANMGNAFVAQGDESAALELFQERLALDRKYRAIVGETPDAIGREELAQKIIDDIVERRANREVRPVNDGGEPET